MKKILLILSLFIILGAGFVSAGGGIRDIVQGMGYENAQYVGPNAGTVDLFVNTCVWQQGGLYGDYYCNN